MLENHSHNLIHQLSEISDSVWRIKKHYLDESKDCESCKKLWQKLEQDYENHVTLLQEEIAKHIKNK